ncbi:TRAP transporter small permease [Paenibacillus abyssi]|uniref:C4-dicarboxylate ABC transporter permease n=1 Tax=Paenibacillus abyssi TaxID=1340531 RepID=A0A917CYX3_9BACL|nr:TRAP transporter small permease [Paenibacillus abyssi]GGG00339.1 C4-dicarboxylate ABC transporter permease [Paenibacillus abyssi]
MSFIRKWALRFDQIFENFALMAMCLMTVIVTVQVFTRKVFNFVFFWSEEMTLLLLIWFAFMGIAIGFRERLHLAMDSVKTRFPKRVQHWLDKVVYATVFAFGLYLIVYGWDFTQLMHSNRLAATQWPLSVQYAVMPISGIMICIYSVLQLLGVKTERHTDLDDEEEHA